MTRPLIQLYVEMAKTKGALGAPMRLALSQARSHRDEFTIRDFVAWVEQAGGKASEASIQPAFKRLIAPEGEAPSAEHPLIVTRPGRRGPGGQGFFKYAFDGDAGAAIKTDRAKDAYAALAQQQQQQAPDDDGAEDGVGAGEAPVTGPNYLPLPDENGSFAEVSMARLVAAGHGPDDPMWSEIARLNSDIEVHAVAKRLPPQLQRSAVRVGQEIFKNLNKPWEGGGPQQPKREPEPPPVSEPTPAKPTAPTPPKSQGPKVPWNPFSKVIRRPK